MLLAVLPRFGMRTCPLFCVVSCGDARTAREHTYNGRMFRTEASHKRIMAWNAAGSAVYAFSSFLMLLIVIRACGDDEGGVFSIGYAIAQLMLTVGVFESTTYFATDAGNRFTYAQYLAFKVITCVLMVVVSIFYVMSFGFDEHKAAVAYALCAFRLFEAVAQYWFGAFQKLERLDLGGFSTVWRSLIAIALFAGVIIVTGDVVLATVIATISEAAWIAFYDIPRLGKLVRVGRPDFTPKVQLQLLWACLPLFISSFLAAYLNNICKYAINDVGTDQMQAVFNVLFMPAFVINLFLIFFMRPSLTTLAKHWLEREMAPFLRILGKLLVIAAGITVGVIAMCAVVGIPILEWFYGMDLGGQMPALLIVMLGGGFLSASNVFYNALVVIRSQHSVLVGYAVAIVIASLIATPLVAGQGIMGACIAYCLSCVALFVAFAITFAVCAWRKTR